MKTIGWAAIIYTVHDAYSFGALVLLVAGELAAACVSGKRLNPDVRKKLSSRGFKLNLTICPYCDGAEIPFHLQFQRYR